MSLYISKVTNSKTGFNKQLLKCLQQDDLREIPVHHIIIYKVVYF